MMQPQTFPPTCQAIDFTALLFLTPLPGGLFYKQYQRLTNIAAV